MRSLLAALALLSAPFLTLGDDMEMSDGMDEGGDYGGGDYGDYGGMGGMGGYGDYGGYGGMGGGGYGGYGDDEYGGGSSGPAWSSIDDFEAVAKFIDEDETEPAVIGFFNDDTNKADVEVFEEVANSNRYSMRFAYSVEDDVRDAMKIKSGCAVFVYTPPRFFHEKYDKKRARYPGKSLDSSALTKFIMKKGLPLVGQKTWKSQERYDAAHLPIVTLFTKVDLEKNPKGYDYYANRLRRVAQDFVGKLVFNIGDKEDFSYNLEDYDLDLPEKKDIGVGVKDGNKHYKMTESFSVDNLRAFVQDVVDGKLTPKIKEEPDYSSMGGDDEEEEDDGSESAVVTVTEDNFQEVVQDSSKDVMIEFYAPWCGHCKQLKPTYKKLASKFEGVDSVTIAAMDASEAEVPSGFDVQGFPTIMFVPAKEGATPIPYEDARDLDSMAEFVKANAAVSIKDEL